jgi:hypothetical protein
VTSIEIQNPSAFSPLRIYQQDRARNVFVTPAANVAMPKKETRAELEQRGAEIITRQHRVTAMDNGALRSVTRDVPEPLWQVEGAGSLAEWVTNILDKIADDIRKGPPASATKGQRVVDSWGEPKPFASVQPGSKMRLTLSEEKRFLAACDEEVGLAIANTSNSRTIRLRNVDLKTGETSNTTHISPAKAYAQAGVINAGKLAAGIELCPT